MSIWGLIAIFIPLLILVGFIMSFSAPQEEIEVRDELSEIYQNMSIYITPQKVAAASKEILGINWNAKLTPLDITLMQEWIVANINLVESSSYPYPMDVFNYRFGNHLGLTILEYSMILAENPNANSFILYTDKGLGLSSATITFFKDGAFFSDVTLPKENLSVVCNLSLMNPIPGVISQYNFYKYDVKYAFSEKEKVSFLDNEEFSKWFQFKISGG